MKATSYDSGSYNKSGWFVFLFSISFSFVFFIYIGVFHEGVDLKEIPEDLPTESTLAKEVKPTVDINAVTNPWVETEDMVIHGQKVYQQVCALCHGKTGKGDGLAGRSLPVLPRDFVKGKWKTSGSSKDLYEIVTKGQGSYMASFAHLPKNDRWAVVHYIRSITQNKVKDNPKELEEFGKAAE